LRAELLFMVVARDAAQIATIEEKETNLRPHGLPVCGYQQSTLMPLPARSTVMGRHSVQR
jgi:hypothetical protein